MKLLIGTDKVQIITNAGTVIHTDRARVTNLAEETDMISRALQAMLSPKSLLYKDEPVEIITTSKLLLAQDWGSNIPDNYKEYVHAINKQLYLLPFENIRIVEGKPSIKENTSGVRVYSDKVEGYTTADELFKGGRD